MYAITRNMDATLPLLYLPISMGHTTTSGIHSTYYTTVLLHTICYTLCHTVCYAVLYVLSFYTLYTALLYAMHDYMTWAYVYNVYIHNFFIYVTLYYISIEDGHVIPGLIHKTYLAKKNGMTSMYSVRIYICIV